MIDGLWTVEFMSTVNRSGNGVVVINSNRILGGDAGYFYTGTCSVEGADIRGDLNVIKYNRNSVSVFGDIDHFALTFNGQIKENKFTAVGNMLGNEQTQIKIVGNKKEDL